MRVACPGDGRIPPNREGSSSSGGVIIKVAAPAPGDYKLKVCVGPAAEPCGSSVSIVVGVAPQEEKLVVVRDDAFFNKALTVTLSDPRDVDTPFDVTIE
jgi:hypothetical protein